MATSAPEHTTASKEAESALPGNRSVQQALQPIIEPDGGLAERLFNTSPFQPSLREATQLLNSEPMSHSANSSIRSATVQRAQRTHGNRFVQRLANQMQQASFSGGPAAVDTQLIPAGSEGRPIDEKTRLFMESRFDADFADVRIHTDSAAEKSTEALSANAYATGRDIYFATGKYEPTSTEGQRLLAHELVHTIQQNGAGHPIANPQTDDIALCAASDPQEAEADRVADAVAQGSSGPAIPSIQSTLFRQSSVQRQSIAGQTQTGGVRDDVIPGPIELTWGTDHFQIFFQRTEADTERLEFIVHYTGPYPATGPFVQNKSQRLSVTIGPAQLRPRTLSQTGTSLEVDLYSDRSRVVKLIDDAKFDDRLSNRGREHDFTLNVNGRFGASASLWVLDPKAQASDIKPSTPEISPGTNPGTIINPVDGAREIRMDGDGDQYPELLIRFRLVKSGAADVPGAQRSGAQTTKVNLEFVHIPTGEKLQKTDFNAPPEAATATLFLPVVKEVTDGKAPTKFSLFVPAEPGSVEIYPPDPAAQDPQYRLVAYGANSTIPYKGKGGIHRVALPDQPAVIGNIVSADISLGAYGDRFRITFQPKSRDTIIFGISALYRGAPVGGMGVEVHFDRLIRFRFVDTGVTSLGLDLDADGKADLQIFDQLTTPEPVDGGGPPESNRNHRIRLTGPVSGGDKFFDFKVRDNYLSGGYAQPDAASKAAESNALAVSSLTEQEQLVDKTRGKLDATLELAAIDRLLAQARRRARDENLIRPETFNVWDKLARDFILLDPQILQRSVDATLQQDSAGDAQKFYDELAFETKSANKMVGAHSVYVETNPYTDLNAARDLTPGQELSADIRAGRWDSAKTHYLKLVDGLDRWIANALQKKYGPPDANRPDSNLAGNVEYLAGLRRRVADVQAHSPTRIAAVFHPGERNEKTGRINEIPLSLYYWREDDKWHLKDATDDDGPDETTSVGANETEPPYALFLKLAESPHYPAGTIHYQMPGGAGGQVHPTGPGTWRKVLTWIGIGAAAIGLGLVTFGEGTVAVIGAYVLGGSALVGGGMALLDLVERGIHGNLSAQTAILDSAQIIAAVSGLGVLRAGRILSVARAAAAESTPLTESAALSVQWAQRYVVPLAATNIGADTVTLAVFSEAAAKQYDAIDKMPGTDESRRQAKLLLLTQMALTAGLTALSVRGNAAEITFGRNFDIVILKGIPVAIPKGTSVMGQAVLGRRPTISPDVDEATFFARERVHLEGIRSDIRAPTGESGVGGEALAQVEDLALRTAWRSEEARRILGPIQQGSRSLAETDAAFRKQLGQFMSEAQAIIDSPSVAPPQKQATLRALVRAFEAAHPSLKSNIDFSAVDTHIGALGGQGAAGIMVADSAGNLVRDGQSAGTLQELLERVARANNASAAHGIGTEYVVEMKPGEAPGTVRVEVISRPRSPSITAYTAAQGFIGVPERAQTLADALTRLRSLHAQSKIEVLSDGQFRINGQLEISASDLGSMPNEDVTNLLKWTKELQAHDGNVNALGEGKRVLAALTKKYRLRLEYERQQVDEMLLRLGLINSDGTSRYPIFENMSTVDRNRLFGSVLKADLPTVEATVGTPTDPALRSQAIGYALSRNPDSVAAFVRHFEFYVAEFARRADVQFEAFTSELNRRVLAAGGDESKRESLRAALMKEMGIKSLQAGLRGKALTEMGTPGSATEASSATRTEVAAIYDRMAAAVGSRFGGSQIKLQPGETVDTLGPEEVVRRIQASADDVTFASLEAVVYHARKHFNELPSTEVIKSAQGTVLPENEVESYLKSLITTIRNPAKDAKVIAGASRKQGDSRSYEFPRGDLRAVVYVNGEGKVTVATYGR